MASEMPTGAMAPPKGMMAHEGMPPSKQMQSEESLPALDEQERKAVQTRARQKLMGAAGGDGARYSARTSGSKTPKTGSSRVPGYMTPKTGGRSARKSPQSSRSSIVTNRTSSPTGRYHPDPERRLDIRQADLHANNDYLAPNGAPDNDRKAKESSWLVSQAFIEGLRYYPNDQVAIDSNDCVQTYSGNTHGRRAFNMEHMETDLRSRLSIAPADPEWRDDQCPREWVPEKRKSMVKHMAKVRERLKR